jgi:hypothetical protein
MTSPLVRLPPAEVGAEDEDVVKEMVVERGRPSTKVEEEIRGGRDG